MESEILEAFNYVRTNNKNRKQQLIELLNVSFASNWFKILLI